MSRSGVWVTGLALAVGVLVPFGGAQAEVRLRSVAKQQPALQIQATRHGIWTPLGALDASVLNPAGDILGHGAPGHAVDSATAWVAWHVPDRQELRLAKGSNGRWAEAGRLPGVGPVAGAPLVVPADGLLQLAWQGAAGDSPVVHVATVSLDGTVITEPVEMAGRLLDAWRQSGSLHVLLSRPGLGGDDIVLVTLPSPTEPIELFTTWLSVVRQDANAGILEHQVTPLVDSSLLSWWSGPGELSFVEVDAGGALLPVRQLDRSGQGERPRSLLNEALRLVRAR